MPRAAVIVVVGLLLVACGGSNGRVGDDRSTANATSTTLSVETTSVATSAASTGVREVTLAEGASLTGLKDRDEVHVTVASAPRLAWVLECLDSDPHSCWEGETDTSGTIGRDGVAVVSIRRAVLSRETGERVDCADAPGRCVLRVATGDEAATVPGTPVVSLTFDRDAPLVAPVTELSVEPSTGLRSGQEVQVVVTNVPDVFAHSMVDVRLCADDFDRCQPLDIGVAVAPGATLDTTTTLSRIIEAPSPTATAYEQPLDCAEVRCSVRVVAPALDPPVAPVPVSFVA